MTTALFATWREAMTVTVPEGKAGNAEIRRFTVARSESTLSYLGGGGRGTPPGTYTGLYRRSGLWMSDTPDERRDHMKVCYVADRERAERVLVNGLGLGMVVAAFLAMESVSHVDVVEIDADVIALVGPHYEQMAADVGKTITIHHADAYTIQWPSGTAWDVAWHDIWRDLCTDNLAQMATLHRRYGRRTQWQGSWGRELLEYRRRFERRRGW
jgi:hypothetical protein